VHVSISLNLHAIYSALVACAQIKDILLQSGDVIAALQVGTVPLGCEPAYHDWM
jgi:hypothetical protein